MLKQPTEVLSRCLPPPPPYAYCIHIEKPPEALPEQEFLKKSNNEIIELYKNGKLTMSQINEYYMDTYDANFTFLEFFVDKVDFEIIDFDVPGATFQKIYNLIPRINKQTPCASICLWPKSLRDKQLVDELEKLGWFNFPDKLKDSNSDKDIYTIINFWNF